MEQILTTFASLLSGADSYHFCYLTYGADSYYFCQLTYGAVSYQLSAYGFCFLSSDCCIAKLSVGTRWPLG